MIDSIYEIISLLFFYLLCEVVHTYTGIYFGYFVVL